MYTYVIEIRMDDMDMHGYTWIRQRLLDLDNFHGIPHISSQGFHILSERNPDEDYNDLKLFSINIETNINFR